MGRNAVPGRRLPRAPAGVLVLALASCGNSDSADGGAGMGSVDRPACIPLASATDVRVIDLDTGMSVVQETLDGTVVDQGTGVPEGLSWTPAFAPEPPQWLQVQGGGRTWTLIQQGVGPLPALAEGEAVRVGVDDKGGGFSPRKLRLVIERDGEVLHYHGMDGSLQGLTPPAPFTLAAVTALCQTIDTCGEVFDVEASLTSTSGGEVTIAPGDEVSLDGYRVRYPKGRDGRATGGCADWYAGSFELVMTAE